MRKICCFLLLACISCALYGQTYERERNRIAKVNLTALAFRNLSVQYEWQAGRRTSLELNGRFMPFGNVLYPEFLNEKANLRQVEFRQMKLGSFAIGPSMKFYLGENAMKGFYAAMFVSLSHSRIHLPVKYGVAMEQTAIFKGNLSAATLGFQLGSHFRLSDRLSLDWWIFGPNLGGGTGKMTFNGQLSHENKQSLENEVRGFKRDFFLDIVKDIEVRDDGASFKTKGPIAGQRAFGLNLGIRL